MHDHPTALSHYLRTGRNVSTGQKMVTFDYLERKEYSQTLDSMDHNGHKSHQSIYDDGGFLSHKSWNTLDFWDHYKRGKGKSIDLANVGLLSRFRMSRSVSKAVEDYKERQILLAQEKAMEVCRKLKETDSPKNYIAFSDRDDTVTNVTEDLFRLFSVGHSTFFRSARCVLDVNCAERTIRLQGILRFSIDDAFVDARDLFNATPGNQEFEGGVPFKIVANWTNDLFWRGKF